MINEWSATDWMQRLGIAKAQMPRVLLTRGTRNLKGHYNVHRGYCENVTDVAQRSSILEDIFIGTYKGVPMAYASVYGPSMAADVVQVFGVIGVQLLIHTGTCSGLWEEMLPGDVILATEAYCGDGASLYYHRDGGLVAASVDAAGAADLVKERSVAFHTGAVYTTAAPFARGKTDVEGWSAQGFAGVDAETAAVLAVAQRYGMDSAAILFALDSPLHRDDRLNDGINVPERRQQGENDMKGLAFSLMQTYG